MKKLFENWRKYITEAEYEPGRAVADIDTGEEYMSPEDLRNEPYADMFDAQLAKDLTDKMHAKWLEGYRKENGDKPRFKPIPNNPPLENLKGYEGIEVIDGVVHQNINQEADKIEPSLANKLNGAPAADYAKAVGELPITSAGDIEALASKFHKIWMKHNSWQKDSNPSLFVDYSQLPADEKRKDLDQLKVAIDIAHAGNQEIQQLFNQVYRNTK